MANMNECVSPFWQNGPAPGAFYNFPNYKSPTVTTHKPSKHTMNPTSSGTSVLAMKFKGGVIVAADTLGSYGSMAMFRDVDRLIKVNNTTVLGAGGDIADFQYLQHVIEERVLEEDCLNDGFHYTPKSLYSWLTRVMYYRRSKFDPLWNTVIVAGLENGEPFLGQIDKIGCAFTAPALASGFGAYIALPLLREAVEKKPDMSVEEAQEHMDKCLKTLFYRDCRALNRYKIAIVTAEGARIEGPRTSKTDFSTANMIKGY